MTNITFKHDISPLSSDCMFDLLILARKLVYFGLELYNLSIKVEECCFLFHIIRLIWMLKETGALTHDCS